MKIINITNEKQIPDLIRAIKRLENYNILPGHRRLGDNIKYYISDTDFYNKKGLENCFSQYSILKNGIENMQGGKILDDKVCFLSFNEILVETEKETFDLSNFISKLNIEIDKLENTDLEIYRIGKKYRLIAIN